MTLLCCALIPLTLAAGPRPRSFDGVQAVPLAGAQIAFEVGGEERARYHFGRDLLKPFVFPLIGPAGRRLTRLGHPHDPEGHSHHRSLWIGHRDVNGVNFWEDRDGRIVHQRVVSFEDGADAASLCVELAWRDGQGKTLLNERRTMALRALENGESYFDITLKLSAADEPVTFGKAPFGFLGVRVAKSMGVNDGGGRVLNSEGGQNESGTHWKQARWVDTAGPVSKTAVNGLALFDHPDNPNHVTVFHVRDDGWMGASFSYDAPVTLTADKALELRYRLYAHGDVQASVIEEHWQRFSQE